MSDRDIPKRLLFSETWGHRRQGQPKLRCLDGVTDDLTKIGVRNLERKHTTEIHGGKLLKKPRPT